MTAYSPAVAAEVAAATARCSYGRLIAVLAAPTRDIAAAEDALADAFEAALTTWPDRGIPDNPEGWLLTVARNRLRDLWKSAARRTSQPLGLLAESAFPGEAHMPAGTHPLDEPGVLGETIPDKRLELLFVCAHPAIDARSRTPLMLQVVLGFDAAQIAEAFAVSEASMAQRLVRAKRRIRDAGIPFAVPSSDRLGERLPAVLEAIYGAYAIDWQSASTLSDPGSLAGEALYLAGTLSELIPDEPEVLGLEALIALSAARMPARVSPTGGPVPLDEQNAELWDSALIRRGELLLRRAHTLGRVGRFQLEAAIQSAHDDRARSGSVDLTALLTLHRALATLSPTLGARVALAATIGEADSAAAGLQALDLIEGAHDFQPAWATRAHLLSRCGRWADARLAYSEAIRLTPSPSIRAALAEAAERLP